MKDRTELSGGTFEVFSEKGKGTTIRDFRADIGFSGQYGPYGNKQFVPAG